jgi:hypothetical protein
MTRSIFDPTGDDMIQEGDTFTGPTAQNISHMPPRAVDGKVDEDSADAQVPLKGTEDQGLSRADTERLVDAAEGAVKDGNPDVPAPPPRQTQKITDGDDGELAWMQDA